MESRDRLVRTLSYAGGCSPPRYESEFSEEVVCAWRAQGVLDQRYPAELFGLDLREELGVVWRRVGAEKTPVESEADLDGLRRAYDPASPDRIPEGFPERVQAWRGRNFALYAAPWNEGFLQVIGISDGDSLGRALVSVCERPALAEAVMDLYAGYLESLLGRLLADVHLDYAVLYEPIASNHGPVVSPTTYARFVMPALRRVVQCLERHDVAFRFIWSAGDVRPLIPVWLEAGINGLHLNQAGVAGISYADLRRRYGRDLRLCGGIDWRVVMAGGHMIDDYLRTRIRPLLEAGGYIPHMDDTVRVSMPFGHFQHYRRRLDRLLRDVFGRDE